MVSIIAGLENNWNVFEYLLKNKTKLEYLWKPNSEKWCLLEIVCHLYDEEREDFRARIKSVLEDPEKELTPINPVGWVSKRKYIEQNYEEMVTSFLSERLKSVEWLKSLSNPKWNNAYEHPKLGPMSARLFITNWLAHDYLHIRQIVRLQYERLINSTGFDVQYAGRW